MIINPLNNNFSGQQGDNPAAGSVVGLMAAANKFSWQGFYFYYFFARMKLAQ